MKGRPFVRKLVVLAAMALVAAGGSARAGLAGSWNFDEGSGSFAENSGTNRTVATFLGNATWAPVGYGERGSALQLDGDGDCALVDVAFVRPRGAFTYAFWLRSSVALTAATPRKDLIYGITAARPHISLSKAAPLGTLGGFMLINNTNIADAASAYTATNAWSTAWHHVAFSFNGTNCRWYVNGVLQSVTTNAGVHGVSSGMWVGAAGAASGNRSLNGLMDDVAVFDTALSDGGVAVGQVAGGGVATLVAQGPEALRYASDVLFVVSNATNPVPADAAIKAHLETALSLSVRLRSATDATAADVVGVRLVLLSSTPSSTDLRGKFNGTDKGVLNWERAIFSTAAGDAQVSSGNGIAAGATALTIAAPTHPLAAGLTGTVTVASAGRDFSYGTAAHATGAVVVASVAGNAGWAAITTVEKSRALLNGTGAAGRRVNFFFADATATALTPNGWALFDAAVSWLLNAPAPPADLAVDFGSDSPQDLQPGFAAFSRGPAAGVSLGGAVSDVFPSEVGLRGKVAVAVAAELATGTIDFRDRGDVTGTPEVSLLEDHIKNQAGGIRLTLSGLKPGVYRMTSYHHDADLARSAVDISVDGTPVVTLQSSGGHAVTNFASATFRVVANGVAPVTVFFDNAPGSASAEVPLNGFRLQTPAAGTVLMVR